MADDLFPSYASMLEQQAKISQLQSIGQAVGISSQQMQAILLEGEVGSAIGGGMSLGITSYADLLAQQRRFNQTQAMQTQGLPQGFGRGLGGSMSPPEMSHFGTVKEFRRKFKEYTKEEFREMGSRPVIKEILSGMTKLNKEEIKDRIAEHLESV